MSCHDGSHLGSYERGFDSSTVLATGHVTGEQGTCCALHALPEKTHLQQQCRQTSVARSAGVQFLLDQGGLASSNFAVTFLYPGIYCLSATNVRASLAARVDGQEALRHWPAKPSSVAVYPLYVLVC